MQQATSIPADELAIDSVTGVEVSLPIAGAGGRSLAFILDWHIRLLLAIAWWGAASYSAYGVFSFDAETWSGASALIIILPAAAIYLLYHPILEIAMHGRTPGKRMAGVRIVTREGAAPGVGPLLIRNVFRLIDSLPLFYCLGLAWSIFSRQHVRIGDLAAGTLLVYDRGDVIDAAADAFASAAGTIDPKLGDLVRELLDRWEQLGQQPRMELGNTMLRRLEPQSEWVDDEDVLMSRLRRLVGRSEL